MKIYRMSSLAIIAATGLISLSSHPVRPGTRRAGMSPFLKLGPKAISAAVAGPSYGLFQCQVVGLNQGGSCYDPYQIRHAYQVDTLISAGLDGRGKTIVIVDAFQSPNLAAQLNYYNSFYGLPSLNGLGQPNNAALGTFTQIAPDGLTPFVAGDPDMTMWAEEISLDVTWAHAIAPGANIVLVLAKSDNDADVVSATKYAIDHNLGDVISQSFGENESCMAPSLMAEQFLIFAEATLKNITLLASSGDFGSAQITCDGQSLTQAVSTPADTTLVTGVGGTDLHAAPYCLTALGCNPAANPAPGTYEGETVWNESAEGIGASGGGYSVVFAEPPYQEGAIHGGKQRGVPEIAYNASVLDGVLTYLDIPGLPAGMYSFGGTSAGSPQWAGIIAIADELTGHNLGFINSGLYQIAQTASKYSSSFHDITIGNNAFFGVSGFSAAPGWDPTTGLGSPTAGQLVNYLVKFVSPLDGIAAIATTRPYTNGNLSGPGHMKPH